MKRTKMKFAFSAMMMAVVMLFSSVTAFAAPQHRADDRAVVTSTECLEDALVVPFSSRQITIPGNSTVYFGSITVRPGNTITTHAIFSNGNISHMFAYPDGTQSSWRTHTSSFSQNSLVVWTGDGTGGNDAEVWRVYFRNNNSTSITITAGVSVS